jgi:hypoxanthine phosphoribosyltransferase
MKFYLDYEHLKNICIAMAENIALAYKPHEIVAVVRGGLTPAHIIAKHLRLPVGVLFPEYNELHLYNASSRRIVFVEDLIAKGRTYRQIKNIMELYPGIDWKMAPVLVDSHYDETLDNVVTYGFKTSHWCVFPWEDFDKMQEGDRGLFRHGTDSYGK